MGRIFGFKHQYSQSFLDELAKSLGFEWTKVEISTVKNKEISVCPQPPPTGIIYYNKMSYENH